MFLSQEFARLINLSQSSVALLLIWYLLRIFNEIFNYRVYSFAGLLPLLYLTRYLIFTFLRSCLGIYIIDGLLTGVIWCRAGLVMSLLLQLRDLIYKKIQG